MSDSNELPEAVAGHIKALSAEGDALAEAGKWVKAVAHYRAAWGLLPEPKTQWAAATWLLGALGEVNFFSGNFAAGREALLVAMHCPDAIGNPLLHLRLGQCQLELGDRERAADELARAYMGGGREIFDDEDEKYFAFVKEVLQPPPGGWDQG